MTLSVWMFRRVARSGSEVGDRSSMPLNSKTLVVAASDRHSSRSTQCSRQQQRTQFRAATMTTFVRTKVGVLYITSIKKTTESKGKKRVGVMINQDDDSVGVFSLDTDETRG